MIRKLGRNGGANSSNLSMLDRNNHKRLAAHSLTWTAVQEELHQEGQGKVGTEAPLAVRVGNTLQQVL